MEPLGSGHGADCRAAQVLGPRAAWGRGSHGKPSGAGETWVERKRKEKRRSVPFPHCLLQFSQESFALVREVRSFSYYGWRNGPREVRYLPKGTQLGPDFVLTYCPQSKSKCILSPAYLLGAWGLLYICHLQRTGPEPGKGRKGRVFGKDEDSSEVTFIVLQHLQPPTKLWFKSATQSQA